MDEFGVLMDSIGFKPQSKTPLVNLKPKHNNFTKPTTNDNTSSPSSFLDPCSLPIEELDVIFTNPVHVNNNTLQSQNLLGDVFDQFGSIDFNSNSNNLLLEINEKHEDVFGIFDEPSSSNVEYEEKGLDFEDWVKEFENQSKRSTFNSIVDEEQQSNLENVQHDNDTKSIDQRSVETLDYDIKRWAAGKEGNLRALLSSLQQVLWPECAWHPVSLADLITSDSVNKVYKKATLYVHPDKVQQKNLQQKYIAEKVFHLLQDARNKFRAEELQ